MPETRIVESQDLSAQFDSWLEASVHDNYVVNVESGRRISVVNYAQPDPIDSYLNSDEYAADSLFDVEFHRFTQKSEVLAAFRTACQHLSGRTRVGVWLNSAFDVEVFEPKFVGGIAGSANVLAANPKEIQAPPRNALIRVNVHLQIVRDNASEPTEVVIDVTSRGASSAEEMSEFARLKLGVGEWNKDVIQAVTFSSKLGSAELVFSHSGGEVCSLPVTIIES